MNVDPVVVELALSGIRSEAEGDLNAWIRGLHGEPHLVDGIGQEVIALLLLDAPDEPMQIPAHGLHPDIGILLVAEELRRRVHVRSIPAHLLNVA